MKPKLIHLLPIVLLSLFILVASVQAQINLAHQVKGVATKSVPFRYVDINVQKGDKYEFYVLNTSKNNNQLFATMSIKHFDAGRNVWGIYPPWKAGIGWGAIFNGGRGPSFTVLQIQPARCMPRINKCSEDAVVLRAS